MWLSEIINQSLCDKFYTKKYIYEFDEMDHDALVDQPAHPPIQQSSPTNLNPAPAQQPSAQQPPPINQQVLNKMQPNHVATFTQQFGQQNPLAAGAIGAGIMAKQAMQNNRQ
jgi:hypothetical protein